MTYFGEKVRKVSEKGIELDSIVLAHFTEKV